MCVCVCDDAEFDRLELLIVHIQNTQKPEPTRNFLSCPSMSISSVGNMDWYCLASILNLKPMYSGLRYSETLAIVILVPGDVEGFVPGREVFEVS